MPMYSRLPSLMLFTHDPELAKRAEDAGIDRIVVDFEFRGKSERQSGYHLEVNKASLEDLRRIRKAVHIPILARTNPIHSESEAEIHAIASEGADIVILPMFHTTGEVASFIKFAGNGVKKSLLFETRASVDIAADLKDLGFDEYYVGLNDMAIDYNLSFAYDVLKHDIVWRIRRSIPDRPFGFGGLTVIGGGSPLRTKEILKIMSEYNCSMAILRRAFKRDIEGRQLEIEIEKIKDYYSTLLMTNDRMPVTS